MIRVYICHDNITSLFSALHDAWKERRTTGEAEIAFRGSIDQKLFCEYVEVTESDEKAVAVQNLIQKHMGSQTYRALYLAALSNDKERGNALWGVMLAARKMKDSTKVMENLTDPSVEKAFALCRKVSNEIHYFKEFLRFRELESGILFAKIAPKSQVLTGIAPHFDNRLPLENWMIYDETHKEFVVHEKQKHWVYVLGAPLDNEKVTRVSEEELEIEQLWKGFVDSVAIKERESYERQRSHFPIWYRKNAVEFSGFEGKCVS